MRTTLLALLATVLLATVVFFACQDDKNLEQEAMPDQFIDDSVRILVGDQGKWVRIRIGVNSRVPVFTGDPGSIGVGLTREAFERRFRWAQILVDAPDSDPRDLPRFDTGMTEREAAASPATDRNRQARETRKSHNDPFQRTNSTFPPHRFHDSPTADRWVSYVILFEVRESGGKWSAAIVKIWQWSFDGTRDPKNQVTPVLPTDDDFKDALDKAKAEFGGAFEPGAENDPPIPPAR